MLPFSSITSLIPLVILGIAYMAYFGTSVLSRQIPQPTIVIPDKVVGHNIISSEHPAGPDFRQLDDQVADEAIFDVPDEFSHNTEILPVYPVIHRIIASSHRISCFIPRPPPLCEV